MNSSSNNLGVHFSSETDDWSTPHFFYRQLDSEFHFQLDPCSDDENHKCRDYYTVTENGLNQPWFNKGHKVVFMNPPYGEPRLPCKPGCQKKQCERLGHTSVYVPGIIDWMAKANEEAALGCTVVCLVPARSDAQWWHRNVVDQGHEVRYVEGRLKFGNAVTSAPFPSAVIVMRPPSQIVRHSFYTSMSNEDEFEKMLA